MKERIFFYSVYPGAICRLALSRNIASSVEVGQRYDATFICSSMADPMAGKIKLTWIPSQVPFLFGFNI
jgi:hypothetical protein